MIPSASNFAKRFVLALFFGLTSVFIENPSVFAQTFNPTFSGRIADGDGSPPYLKAARDVVVSGNFAYVGGFSGLEILDVTLPGAPVHKGSLRSVDDPAVSAIAKLYVAGNYVYAISYDNLLIIDVSNPAAPKRVGVYRFPVNFSIYGLTFFVSGSYVYVSSHVSNALRIIDVSNPANPVLVSGSLPSNTITNWPSRPQAIFVAGNTCYWVDALPAGNTNNYTLKIVDITNKAAPSLLGSLYIDNLDAAIPSDMAVTTINGVTIAVVVQRNGISFFNVTNPSNPTLLRKSTDAVASTAERSIEILEISGTRFACVTSNSRNVMEVFNIQDVVNNPITLTATVNDSPQTPLKGATGIFVNGTRAYVASARSSAVEILNLSTPAFPSHVGNIFTSANQILLGSSLSCAVSGSYVFVTNISDNSIAVLDISDPRNPRFVNNILNGNDGAYINRPFSAIVNGNYLYITNYTIDEVETQASVQVFNITDPQNPVAAGQFLSNYSGRDIAISGDYAYVLMENQASNKYFLQVLDISNPDLLSVGSTVETDISSINYPPSNDSRYDLYHTVSILDGKAYIIARGFLVTFDLTNPAAPGAPSYLPISAPGSYYASSGTVRRINGTPYAFIANTYGPYNNGSGDNLTIVNLNTSAVVKTFSTPFMNATLDVIVKNNSYYLMLAKFGSSNIDIFDVTDPPNSTKIKTLDTYAASANSNLNLSLPYSVSSSGNLAFVTTGSLHFEILDLFGSSITNFSPTTGAENSSVTVTGQNFDSFVSVAFNGLNGVVTSYTPTQATVTVPPGATIGKVTVTSRGSSTSSGNFLVIPNGNSANGISQNGFIANWSNVGATKYFLDVSTSNTFSTFVTGNNNRDVGNVTSASVTGLTPGSNYHYRVRSSDGIPSSGNSATISVLTVPATPTGLTATTITQSGFHINWNLVSGIVGNYFLDVATDAAFTNFVPGYNNLAVSGTGQVVSGLNPGTYHARVRSANASGSSPNSTSIAIATVPPNVVATSATAVTSSGLTANWTSSPGAISYQLDVSTNNFATFVPGYENLPVGNVSTLNISGLASGVSHQYRVRAVNANGVAGNSNVIAVITIPASPVAASPSSVTNTSFTANWALSVGANSYLLEWATNVGFTSGYGSHVTPSGNISSFNITGLAAGTQYYYRITATNQSGSSAASSVISSKTLATPATTQSSNLSFTNVSSTSVTVNFSAGNGTSRLVVVSAGSPLITGLPINQTSYAANSNFGSGSAIGNGFVVAAGGSSVQVTGLSPSNTYFFRIFDFTVNINSPSGTENYLTATAQNNPLSVATLASSTAITQPTNLTFQSVTVSSVSGSFTTAAGNPTGYLVVRSSSSTLSSPPLNGIVYSPGSTIGSTTVVSSSSATTFSDSGLSAGTTYYYSVYSYNGSGASISYLTTNPLQSSFTTIPAAPVIAAASLINSGGFTANWSIASGAVDYLLDISTNNFGSLVPGFTNLLVGAATSYEVQGLSAGTTYQYRVRARNNFGSSVSSSSASATTLPAAPSGVVSSSTTENSFRISWLASAGATGYFIDVSPNSEFTTLTYSNISAGDNVTYVVSGLSPSSTYYIRVRSGNASGQSLNSVAVSATTFAAQPIVQTSTLSFTNVNSTSMTVTFTPGSGTSRLLVVSSGAPLNTKPDNGASYTPNTTYGEGTAIGNGYVVSTSASTVTITNLLPTTVYFFQVFDFNGAAGTENYNVSTSNNNPRSQSTIAFDPIEQPTNIAFSGQASTSVNVSFTPAVNNPSGYLVLRSVNGPPSLTPVNGTTYTIGAVVGNAVVASAGSSISFFDGGLPTGLRYYYTVYAFNGIGPTSSYLTVNPLQGNVILDTAPPVVSFPGNNPTVITEGNTPLFSAAASDNVSVSTVNFYYRGISQVDFQSASMIPAAGDTYTIQVQSDWYDSLGIEYYVTASDQNNNTSARSASNFARLIKPSITIPSLPTGTGIEDYRIISFPYLLTTNNEVTTVYSNVPWNDNTKAGLWWWNPSTDNGLGGYDQYGNSPTFRTIDPGKGYWAITSTPVTPQLSNVPAPNYSRDKLYQMNLKPGWNQIGNPYPIAISWDDVIAYNQALGSASFGKLNIYDGQAIREATASTLLKAFEGGFVRNLTSSEITIQIPMPGQVSGGRKNTNESNDVSQDAWKIFLHIQQSGLTNELGGFGMHPRASIGEDHFDNFNIPVFVSAPELQFSKKESTKVSYSTDVVNTQLRFVWTFQPKGVVGAHTQLSWNEHIVLGDKQLYLYDEENLNIIDMSQVSSYTFRLSSSSSFKIYFGKDVYQEIGSEAVQISEPHPNPLTNESTLIFKTALPKSNTGYSLQIQVLNLQGISVYQSNRKIAGGIQDLEVDINSEIPAGIYVYRLTITGNQTTSSFTGKIVKL